MAVFSTRRDSRQANRATRRSERQLMRQTRLASRGERQAGRQSMIQNIAGKALDTYKAQQLPPPASGGLDQYGTQEPIAQTAGFGKFGWLIALVVLGVIMKKK